MATRVLVIILFFLSVLTSSALTYFMINKSDGATSHINISQEVEKFITQNPPGYYRGIKESTGSKRRAGGYAI